MVSRVNGARLLRDFDERLGHAERTAAAAQEEADRVSARLDALRAEEARLMGELARIRLADLGETPTAELANLDAAGIRARDLMGRREAAASAIGAELHASRAALATAERRRDEAAAQFDAAEAEAARELEAARTRMEADAAWRAARDTADEAARVARHADDKAGFAVRDREDKGRPYREDALFRYLWERGFGTAAYRAGPFTRLLDGFVARVARFEPARRAYALLLELPDRLREHAARMAEEAALRASALAALERELSGLSPERAGEAAALRASLEAAEDALEAAHGALAGFERRRAALEAGEDPETREAATLIERTLASQTARDLAEAAARTPTPEDDAVVARLVPVLRERAALAGEVGLRRLEAQGAREEVEKLLELRGEMRRRGYARSDWSMGNQALLGVLLGQVLGGTLSRGGFWDRMERHRLPDGGPWGNSPWGGGGGFGGGGFTTGGGFGGGGGGFRSGGGF